MKIRGTTVYLIEKEEVGKDPFGDPIYATTSVAVPNVLVAPTSSDDVVNQLNLTGRKAIYTLAIPKNDEHEWEGKEVEFFGQRFKTVGKVLQGIPDLIPLNWNKKIGVEIYE